jgi:hypothetical protein
VDHPVYKAYFTFLYYNRVRRSDARAVEKKDIIDGFVSINKFMHQYKKEFKSLKTNSFCQKIQQNKHVLEMITPLMELDGPMLFEDYEDLSSTSIQLYFSNGIKK